MVSQNTFMSENGDKHPNSKSGQDLDPDKLGCNTSCRECKTDPDFFFLFLSPIPNSANRP